MPIPPRTQKLGQLLVRAKVIDPEQLGPALSRVEQFGTRLTRVVVEMRLARESTLVEALAKATGLQAVDLTQVQRSDATAMLEVDLCEARGILPVAFAEHGRVLKLAMADPTDLETLDHVAAKTRCRVIPLVAGEGALDGAIGRIYRGQFVGQGTEPPAASEMGEFKLVDRAGKTLHPAGEPPRPAADAALTALREEVAALRNTVEQQDRAFRAVVEALLQRKALTADEILKARQDLQKRTGR